MCARYDLRNDPRAQKPRNANRNEGFSAIHRCFYSVQIDTIMQPVMRNKKTVLVPKVNDLKVGSLSRNIAFNNI